ncbi:flavin reductase family protein [Desulfopila aestuarii]|uniref:NADH-FMN oxidoreductase RutF, flavin reductase (DIM6/NTAB) family n=1 Tax=Desulfopila aestuarii DSM 18488 TaxID=1121416 RepID=A0A1M7YIZ9_9BACT|nr:flavin reductase family protein [Desulfopila aestuarii]SHO52580.1 NADH-FMN oxidoreductase RutF, flavin reductase (DIM6/NTAB) family [Desulfopila aestuarii DSM 18488]
MKRIAIGPKNGLYPSLTTIVGAEPDDKPNWITIAHVGIMNHATGAVPQYLSIGLNRSHYTNKGIHEHGEFSINIPSVKMMQVTDYVGLVSGATTDKSELFPIARGTLKHAPMIADVPLSMECKLVQAITLGHHEIFIGEVVETFVDESCLTDGKPDLEKIDPLLFDFMKIDYWSLGQRVGLPWREGKTYKTDNK